MTGERLRRHAPSLLRARDFSRDAMERFADAISTTPWVDDASVLCIVAAGSLGRLEASSVSDVDCMILVDETASPDMEAATGLLTGLDGAFERAGLAPPKADGIYTRPIPFPLLIAQQARGSLDELPALFGSRMQMLLDGRALYRADSFDTLRERVLHWYAGEWPAGAWTHLYNDLSRYLHAYAVWQQFKMSRSEDDGWLLRQAKFRSSRIVTFAGMMCLLAEGSRQAAGDPGWIAQHLDKTPLERLLFVLAEYDDPGQARFIETYDCIHARLSDPMVRAELIAKSPRSPDEVARVHSGAYAEIHALSASLLDELTRFILARRDDWPLAVFRNWLL